MAGAWAEQGWADSGWADNGWADQPDDAEVPDPGPDPDPGGDPNGGGTVPGHLFRFAGMRNTLRMRSQNCDDPRLTEAQRVECRKRKRGVSRIG